MKCLKSSFFESSWKSPRIKTRFPVVMTPIEKLWPNVPIVEVLYNRPFKKNLKDDIEKNGLINPLILIALTCKELRDQKDKHKEKLNDLPFNPNEVNDNSLIQVIWGGSQRLALAKEMGFTHIDCVICDTISNAHILQREMRKEYKSLLYSRNPHDKP